MRCSQALGGGKPTWRRRRQRRSFHRLTRPVADRAAVLARHREHRIAEQRIDGLDRTPGDDGNRVAQQSPQLMQHLAQSRWHNHRIRPRRDIQQRAVEIEQQRRAIERRENRGASV